MPRRSDAFLKRPLWAIPRLLPPLVSFLLLLIIWEVAVRVLNVPLYLIPSPSNIIKTLLSNFPSLLRDTGVTLLEAVFGFLIGGLIGFFIAVIFAHSRLIETSFYPYFVALQSVPIVAIAPLLVLWFGNGIVGKIVMSSIVCFFPVVVNMTIGLRSVERDQVNLLKLLGATSLQIFLKLRLPTSLPFLMSAMKIAASLSVIGAIVAEIAGARQGLGFRIVISSYRTDTQMMFAAIILAALAGIGLFKTIGIFEKKVLFWHTSSN